MARGERATAGPCGIQNQDKREGQGLGSRVIHATERVQEDQTLPLEQDLFDLSTGGSLCLQGSSRRGAACP